MVISYKKNQGERSDLIPKGEWKPIPMFEGRYLTSAKGEVLSHPNPKNGRKWIVLRQSINPMGYPTVSISINSIRKTYLVHRLVAMSFLESKGSDKNYVNHINGIKSDNCIYNLEWCSASENIQHAFDTGLKVGVRGEKNNWCSITDINVIDIFNSNLSRMDLSVLYGINIGTIDNIKNGKTRSEVTGKVYEYVDFLPIDSIIEISKSSLSCKELMKKFNTSQSYINFIKSGRTYSQFTGITFYPKKVISDKVILDIYNSLLTRNELSKIYGISIGVICSIKLGRNIYSSRVTKHKYEKKIKNNESIRPRL